MKLSIIIPCYNVENYIKETLDSIFNQVKDRKDIEVITLNDGSKDNTLEVLKEYNKTVIIDNSNHGVSYTRNDGIKKAKGKFIMFVDSDDLLEKDWLEIIDEYLETNNDIVYFNSKFPSDNTFNDVLSYILAINEKNISIAGPVLKLFKKEFLLNNNLHFNNNLTRGEDLIFNLKCLKKADKYQLVNKSFYLYRRTPTSLSRKLDIDKINPSLFHNELSIALHDFGNKIDKNYIKYVYNISLSNSLMSMLVKINMLNSYKEIKKIYKILLKTIYKDIDTRYLSFRKKVTFFLLKKKMYLLLFLEIRLLCFLKKKNDQKEYFEKI